MCYFGVKIYAMKKLLILLFAGTMLSGCYTHICPTYAVKPAKKQEIQAQQHQDELQQIEKTSL